MDIQKYQNSMLVKNWIQWYNNTFKESSYYKGMQSCVENSCFHRENSVATHTDMVVMNMLQLNLADGRPSTDESQLAGLFAAAFHDVGKPIMKEEKFSEERGNYFSFSGHEIRSARMWEDFFMSGPEITGITEDLFNPIVLDDLFMFKVGFMIEHHRPWGLKDVNKMDGLSLTISSLGLNSDYYRLLLADNMGRIGDSPDTLTKSVDNIDHLLSNFIEYCDINKKDDENSSAIIDTLSSLLGVSPPDRIDMDVESVIIPIAASGSGKSTLYSEINEQLKMGKSVLHHSMDDIRIELYGSDPKKAFQDSVNDPNFQSHVQKDFIDKIKTGNSVYVDNTNISRKRRRFYINQARQRGLNTVGIIIPITFNELISRQELRGDKRVPKEAVARQYFNMSYPMFGLEFDSIHIHSAQKLNSV